MNNKLKFIISVVVVFAVVFTGFIPPTYAQNSFGSGYDYDQYRISGNNRYATAYEIAKVNYQSPDTVIIVRGDSEGGVPQVVDGLTAGGLAGVRNAPILLVEQNRLPDDTRQALKEMNPKNAVIIGGTAAVSAAVEQDLRSEGLSTQRISGANRQATAAEVAKAMGSAKNNTAIIVDGRAEVDSLLAGPLAHKGYPILMVNNARGSIPAETRGAIESLGIKNIIIVGGTGVVSDKLEKDLNNLSGVSVQARYGGANRVETGIAVSKHPEFNQYPKVSLVNGDRYVDAVAVSTLGNPVMYFREGRDMPRTLSNALGQRASFRVIGGSTVISEDMVKEAMRSMNFSFTRITRHSYPIENVLDSSTIRNTSTRWDGTKWVSAGRDAIQANLLPQSFYESTRVDVDRAAERIRINTDTLRVRSQPNTTSTILTTVSRGQMFNVLEEQQGWIRINTGSHTGWVSGDFVQRSGTYKSMPDTAAKVTVNALNVRTGPSTGYQQIGQVARDEVFSVTGGEKGWYQIEFYDQKGWVIGDFINLVKGMPKEKYQFLELSGSTGATSEDLNQLLADSPLLRNRGKAFLDAGRANNINELYLTAHALTKSEGITQTLVEGRRVSRINGSDVTPKVVYNVFGIEGKGANPNTNAATFAYEQGWDTLEKSIAGGAKILSEQFIHHPTSPQTTLYEMRWDPANRGANYFSTDIAWAINHAQTLQSVYNRSAINNRHFNIPVFETSITRTWPVPGYTRVSSFYGLRTHPITGEPGTFHYGIDIPAPAGVPIVAAKAGVVIRNAYSAGYGNWMEVDHGNGVTTRYAHNSKNISRVGDVVEMGEKIAEIGTTGNSTGNHLHFEVRVNGVAIDPWPWLNEQ